MAGEHRLRLLAAFAAIYLIWGSTYLAIRYAVETMPPFLMAAARFVVSGVVLYAWARQRGAQKPPKLEWRDATITGVLIHEVRTAISLQQRARNFLISHCHIYNNTGVGIHLDSVNLHQTIITGSACRPGPTRASSSPYRTARSRDR